MWQTEYTAASWTAKSQWKTYLSHRIAVTTVLLPLLTIAAARNFIRSALPLRSSKNSLERIPQTIEQYKEKAAVLTKAPITLIIAMLYYIRLNRLLMNFWNRVFNMMYPLRTIGNSCDWSCSVGRPAASLFVTRVFNMMYP